VIGISFDPFALSDPEQIAWWEAWQEEADEATEKIVEAFEYWLEFDQPAGKSCQLKFDQTVWKRLKDWYMENVFHRKCAYCERLISGYYGDAEHYRPKGTVTTGNEDGSLERPTCEVPDPRRKNKLVTVNHPGYFWLAYDWRNLLPSCVFCNSGQGKNERFDARKHVAMVWLKHEEIAAIPEDEKPRASKKWRGFYYPSPSMLDEMEEPMLLRSLNASVDCNPRKHLKFGVKGLIAAVDDSQRGKASIKLLRLEGVRDLDRDRQRAQEEIKDKYYDALRRFDLDDPQKNEAKKLLENYERGLYPFSAAALDYLAILEKAAPKPQLP